MNDGAWRDGDEFFLYLGMDGKMHHLRKPNEIEDKVGAFLALIVLDWSVRGLVNDGKVSRSAYPKRRGPK